MDSSSLRILVIDDEPLLRRSVAEYLEEVGFTAITATDGAEGMRILESTQLDIVFVDLNMPVMDGYAFIEAALGLRPDLPIVVVSGVGNVDNAIKAIRLGAWDYITKPITRMEIVVHAVRRVFDRAQMIQMKRNYQQNLERLVQKRTTELETTRRQISFSLGKAAEYRDNETGRHVIRVGEMCAVLAKDLAGDQKWVRLIRESAPMHDIGKIGIPDHILLKPGPLSAGEWSEMKMHCRYGCLILSQPHADGRPSPNTCSLDSLRSLSGQEPKLMDMARTIALCHHEHWDGNGYPHGLSGEDIPLEARIVALVDVYDALGSNRPYKEPFAENYCQQIISDGAGTHFDPDVAQAFFRNIDAILFFKSHWRD